MAVRPRILAWRISWTEEPGELPRVTESAATETTERVCMHINYNDNSCVTPHMHSHTDTHINTPRTITQTHTHPYRHMCTHIHTAPLT